MGTGHSKAQYAGLGERCLEVRRGSCMKALPSRLCARLDFHPSSDNAAGLIHIQVKKKNELSFLYDYFYTQYPLLFSDGKFFAARTAIYAFLELVQFLASLWIIVVLSKEFNGGFGTHDRELYRFCQAQNGTWSRFLDFDCSHVADDIHFLGACIFVVVYVVLRILQLVAIVFSNWTKVWLICEYVERPCLQGNRTLESLIGFVCGCKVIPFKPWRRKMSQYSLLSSYNYRPIFKFLTSALFTLPNRGQENQDSKKLDLYVEGAVLDALKDNGLQLTNRTSIFDFSS
ncbi:hypothetical protein ACLOJK_039962 [Asimina triloba]